MLNINRLKNLRERFNYSQEVLAEKIGVSQQQYQRLESGYTKNPRQDTLNKLADVLNSSIEYLTDTEILPFYQKLTDDRKNKSIEFVKNQLADQDTEI